jgi:hypothetical protein
MKGTRYKGGYAPLRVVTVSEAYDSALHISSDVVTGASRSHGDRRRVDAAGGQGGMGVVLGALADGEDLTVPGSVTNACRGP